MEERFDPTLTYQTEFEEWLQSGCEKAEEIMNDSDEEI